MYDPRNRPAFNFMVEAHNSINQKRKYTGEPYWTHPLAVAEILVQNYPYVTPEMVDAALLHDVVEDVWPDITLDNICDKFGTTVALYVDGLTGTRCGTGNRAARKLFEAKRISSCCPEVQTIKVCDMLHNTADITEHDLDFARVYMAEKRTLLDVGLRNAYAPLWKKADKYVKSYYKTLDGNRT